MEERKPDQRCPVVSLAYELVEPDGGSKIGAAPIILTHGLFLNKSVYRALAKELCVKTGRKVYNMDLRSHGDSPYPEEIGIVEMAEDIMAFLQEQGLQRVVFVSHSFSTRVATIVATQKPTLVEKIIMVDFAPYWSDLLWLAIESRANDTYEKFLSKITTDISIRTAETMIIQFFSGSKHLDNIMEDDGWNILRKAGNIYEVCCDRQRIHEAALSGHFRCKAKTVFHGPVLFVKEPNSVFWNNETYDQHLKYFPNQEFVTIPDTSHALPIEKPTEFVNEVQRFLESDIQIDSGVNFNEKLTGSVNEVQRFLESDI